MGSSKDGDDPTSANIEHPSLFYISTLVNERPLEILIDTGAHKSFISNEIVQHLGLQLIPSHKRSHWLADGITPFVTNGEVLLLIKIGMVETKIMASIAETLSCSCILGADWIRFNNVSFFTHENRIVVFDSTGKEIASQAMNIGTHRRGKNLTIGTFSIKSNFEVRQTIENLSAHLENMEQQREVKSLLGDYQEIFDLSRPTKATSAMFHTVDTSQAQPIVQRPRIQSKFQTEETKKHVKVMLEAGQIVPSNSP